MVRTVAEDFFGKPRNEGRRHWVQLVFIGDRNFGAFIKSINLLEEDNLLALIGVDHLLKVESHAVDVSVLLAEEVEICSEVLVGTSELDDIGLVILVLAVQNLLHLGDAEEKLPILASEIVALADQLVDCYEELGGVRLNCHHEGSGTGDLREIVVYRKFVGIIFVVVTSARVVWEQIGKLGAHYVKVSRE